MRDYHLETTFDVKFTTRKFSTGAPFTLAGTPVISAYPDNSLTQLTAGITLTADFDGVTGLNNIRVVATAANGYAAGSNYALVITTGTVDSVSVVGEVVGEFSLEAQSALRPTVALRKLDVSAGGEAGVDWANVGSPTTVVGLSGTTVKTATDVETDTADIQARLPAALTVDGNIKADTLRIGGTLQTANDVGADVDAILVDTAEIGAAGAGLTAINLPDQTMNITGNITGNLSGSVGSVTGAVGSVTGAVGSVTGLTASNLDATVSSRATPANILTTALTESYAADGAAPTLAQALFAIQQFLQEKAISGTTLTVNKLDGTTAAMTFTLDSATAPTSVTRAS